MAHRPSWEVAVAQYCRCPALPLPSTAFDCLSQLSAPLEYQGSGGDEELNSRFFHTCRFNQLLLNLARNRLVVAQFNRVRAGTGGDA